MLAHLEDIVVRNVQKVIPDGVQTWWHEYRQAAKEAKRERTGEMGELDIIGHGVAEAEQRNKQEGASECREFFSSVYPMLTPAQAWPRSWRSHTPSTRASSLSASR